MKRGAVINFADTLARLPIADGKRFASAFEHASLLLEVYAPRGHDPQQPHARDELYIVVEGSGEFVCADTRTRFGRGDALFAPARVVHRFERFSDDLALWVVFYGPEGGEAA